ncbi:acyl carrier protein, partial [Streptomyces glaucus]|uniref:acyl carrier protein n=1 Tax=Streptomyces glaucus TaxID=284029 RepID=UPI0031D71E6D
ATDEALALLDTALLIDEPLTLPFALDTTALGTHGAAVPTVLHALTPPGRRRAAAHTADGTANPAQDLTRRLLAQTPAEQDRSLLDLVRTAVAGVLGHTDSTAVDPARAFKDLGFDSLTAVDLRNRIKTLTGLHLPATLVFDHPSPLALARHLRTELLDTTPSDSVATPGPTTPGSDEPIAIVGMGCRFPGGVAS